MNAAIEEIRLNKEELVKELDCIKEDNRAPYVTYPITVIINYEESINELIQVINEGLNVRSLIHVYKDDHKSININNKVNVFKFNN